MTFPARFRSLLLLIAASLPSLLASCGGSSENIVSQPAAGSTSAGAAGGGTAGTGGAAGTSASQGGKAGSSGGEAGESSAGAPGEGQIATLGDICDGPGELACAGTFQKLSLICSADGQWESNTTCTGDDFCDSTPGPNAGSCQPQVEGCSEPNGSTCVESNARVCGVDTVTSSLAQECVFGCADGACLIGEACPDAEIIMNCDSDCGGRTANCDLAQCSDPGIAATIDLPTTPTFGPLVIRTEQSPGERCTCSGTSESAADNLNIVLELGSAKGRPVRIVTQPPWYMDPYGGLGCVSPTTETCLHSYIDIAVSLFTSDPEAPARNIIVESGTCPVQ